MGQKDKVIDVLLRNYAGKLNEFELAMSSQVLDDVSAEEQKLIDWTLSTYVRRYFMVLIVDRTFKGEHILLSECAKLLGVSRNSADLLFNDTVPQGWILCERNDRGWRQLKASDMLVNLQLRYADRMHNKSSEIGRCGAGIALKQAKQLLN